MKKKLKNIPVPEAHLLSILLGVVLHGFVACPILPRSRIGHMLGWPLIVFGAGISLWAVIESGNMELSSPHKLMTTGPYAYSRNPMYVGWSLIYVGIAFVVNSLWLVLLFPIALIYQHFMYILNEEKALQQKFGSEYRRYRNQVRRYF